MSAPPRTTTRADFLAEYARRAHEMPREDGFIVRPPVVGVPEHTVQQWIMQGNQEGAALQRSNNAIINRFFDLSEFRPPTQEEQNAWQYEASRHMTDAEFRQGFQGSVVHAMRLLWEQRRANAQPVHDPDHIVRLHAARALLVTLFDPTLPVIQAGPVPHHLAAFRRLHGLFDAMPEDMAMYYLRAIYNCMHPDWDGLGAIPVHVGTAVGEIFDRPGQPNHHRRVLDHLCGARPDPIVQRLVASAVRSHPPVFEPPPREELQAMADAAVSNADYAGGNDVEDGPGEEDMGDYEGIGFQEVVQAVVPNVMRADVEPMAARRVVGPFDPLLDDGEPVNVPPPRDHLADLQRLVNEWERDVSPAGCERRRVQLRQHMLGLPSDKDRCAAAWQLWTTHPGWLTLQTALDTWQDPPTAWHLFGTWVQTTHPPRDTLLIAVTGQVSEELKEQVVHHVLEKAKSASLHHWPCLDDTLFLSRLVQLLPSSDERMRVLRRVFLGLVPFVPAHTPSLDDLDWDRYYKPLLVLLGNDADRLTVVRVVIQSMGSVSPRLCVHIGRDFCYVHRCDINDTVDMQETYVKTAMQRQAVAQRLTDEQAAAPKPDAPVAIHQQLAQLEAIQTSMNRAGASADEIKALAGTLHQVVNHIAGDVDKDRACILCMNWERRVRYDPCGHFVACHACSAKNLALFGNKCPKCRAPVAAAQSVFM